jgi:hypothetical protein
MRVEITFITNGIKKEVKINLITKEIEEFEVRTMLNMAYLNGTYN